MFLLIMILFVFLLFCSIIARLIISHPISTCRYLIIDLWLYFHRKKYNLCFTGEIVAYCGLFGRGKTLSCVHKIVTMYKRYNDKIVWCDKRKKFVKQKVKVISNVALSIPYESFVSLEQLFIAAERNSELDDLNDTLTITLVLGDEFSVQLNSRSFKTNINPLFLNTLLTCRHYHLSIYYTAQRFNQVDALLRQVSSYVYECNKVWRFQLQTKYNAWDLENATNPQMIKSIQTIGFFVKNSCYAAYDTLACVKNLKKNFDDGDMMSDTEILQLQCAGTGDINTVTHVSRKLKKIRKGK